MLNGVWLITSTDYLFWKVENGREFEWKGESRAHFPIAPGRSGYRSVRLAEWIVAHSYRATMPLLCPWRVDVPSRAGVGRPGLPTSGLSVLPCHTKNWPSSWLAENVIGQSQ